VGAVGKVAGKVALAGGVLRLAVKTPSEFVDRLEGRHGKRREVPRGEIPPNRTDPAAAAHEVVGIADCGACAGEWAEARDEILGGLAERHPHDCGLALAQIVWIVIRHRRPQHVVETGVARGVSSAFMLDALDRNDSGALWSVDLPPIRSEARVTVGSAVPDRLRGRWTYIRGASQRKLPPLLDELDVVGLFLHDGPHQRAMMTFEFHHVWPYLGKDSILVADDVDGNTAFVDFARRIDRQPLLVEEKQKGSVVGVLHGGP
jgi:hypothetical protein